MGPQHNNPDTRSLSSRAGVALWLFTGCFLIFLMVAVGGITRLTGSGLSITEWKIVTGIFPPLSETEWIEEFNEYKQSPQFRQINSHFSLQDFRSIYWWEYIHRLMGRLIGLVFLIPFIYFLIRGHIKGSELWKYLILFFMGGLQGFIGWYMVKSGLVNEPNVSHYRLALHLSTAFLTFALTFWFALDLVSKRTVPGTEHIFSLKRNSIIIMILVFVQIILGAFVAGLDAGLVYNTFPKMDDSWIAEGVTYAYEAEGLAGVIDSMAGVQFLHRYMAYLVVIIIVAEWYRIRKISRSGAVISGAVRKGFDFLLSMVIIQFLLGVFTLLYAVPVSLGVIHQVGAFALFAGSVFILHQYYGKRDVSFV